VFRTASITSRKYTQKENKMTIQEELVVGMGNYEREIPPAKLHRGCITGIYNIGRQFNNFFQTWNGTLKFKFELDTLTSQGKPFVIYQDYTASMGAKANLRKLVHSIEGRDITNVEAASYSVGSILGRSVFIQTTQKNKIDGSLKYSIINIMPCDTILSPIVTPEKWDFRTSNPNDAPNWIWTEYEKSKDFKQPSVPRIPKPKTGLGEAVAKAAIVSSGSHLDRSDLRREDDDDFSF